MFHNAGMFASTTGATACSSCSIGAYSNIYVASSCMRCEFPETTLTEGSQGCVDKGSGIETIFANQGTLNIAYYRTHKLSITRITRVESL